MTRAPPSFCSSADNIRRSRIDVMMRAKLARELLFVITTIDRHGLETHLSRVLNSEMAQSADAVNCDDVSSASTRVA